jgi:hypothetical protein
MVTISGLVVKLTWSGRLVCAQIGASAASELLVLVFDTTDTEPALAAKRNMVKLLALAQAAGVAVAVNRGDSDPFITAVVCNGFDICPSRAVQQDFFSVSGASLPSDTVVEFDTPSSIITITPDVIRQDWVLIAQLPASVPALRCTVRLRSPSSGWTSQGVPIDVSSGTPEFVRRLYTGAPKDSPYTIAFIACPGIRTDAVGTLAVDPVISNRASFHAEVSFAIDNLLGSAEDVLRQNGLDRNIQFVTIFDASLLVADGNSLVQQDTTNIISPRREVFNAFMGGYGVVADVAMALCGSVTHTRSSAWFTTDNPARGSVSFTYDTGSFVHGRFADTPGTVALSTTAGGLTALHEFGHASSDFNDGMIDDLYYDGLRDGLEINKKARGLSTDAIPATFASYNSTAYASDQTRDGIGYPVTWTSYDCELIDPTRPNMMDNFWLADDPRRCRLDKLTHAWLTDRLHAKVFR